MKDIEQQFDFYRRCMRMYNTTPLDEALELWAKSGLFGLTWPS